MTRQLVFGTPKRDCYDCRPRMYLCVQCQAAAVRMLLSFFGLSILAFEIGERHVKRLVPEADTASVYRHAFFMPRVSVRFAKAGKLCAFNTSLLGNCLELA